MDAVRLSKHGVVTLGNETWCRAYSTGAICSAISKRIPLSAITFGTKVDDLSLCMTSHPSISKQDTNATVVESNFAPMIAKQAPRDVLRQMGISDHQIPIAVETVFACKPIVFAFDEVASVNNAMVTLCQEMPQVAPSPSIGGFSADAI